MVLSMSGQPDAEALLVPIRAEASRQSQQSNEDAVVEFVRVSGKPTPSSCVFSLDPVLGARWRGPVTVMVKAELDGVIVARIPVSVRVRTFGLGFVSTRRIERHETFESDDLVSAKVETTGLREPYLRQIDEIIGYRSKRILNEGTLIAQSLVERVPDIHHGDTITLRLQRNGIAISLPVVSRDDGRLGERVAVRAPGAREWIPAVVVDAHTVQPVDEDRVQSHQVMRGVR
jgi:flagella basal body P-ring formation protein FlgA